MIPEREIIKIIKRLYTNKLTTSSGGNISILDNKRTIYITPSAIDKSNLIVKDIVKIYKSGNIKGIHKPSSEYKFHQAIYENCPKIKAIIHAHPPFIVSYCISAEKINTNIQPEIYNICGEIGYVPYFCPGSIDLANGIANEFKKGYAIVMLQNHGVVVGAASIKEAFQKLVMLNILAEISILAKQLGNINLLNQKQIQISTSKKNTSIKKIHTLKKTLYSPKLNKANHIVIRAYKQNLLTGNLGAISFKINAETIIFSKQDVDWEHFKIKDLYSFNANELTQTSIQSQTKFLFSKIYQHHPEINCIIHTYAPACFAFSITDKLFNTNIVPESNIILKNVAYANFEDYYTNHQAIVDKLSDSKPLIFLKNNGLVITGGSITNVFDRLEVAEFTAKSIIAAQTIGRINTISQEEIKKINHLYF